MIDFERKKMLSKNRIPHGDPGRPIRGKWSTRFVVDQGGKNALESEWDSNGPFLVGSCAHAHVRLADAALEACAITTSGAAIIVKPLDATLKYDLGFRELPDGTQVYDGQGSARVQVGHTWLMIERRVLAQPRTFGEN